MVHMIQFQYNFHCLSKRIYVRTLDVDVMRLTGPVYADSHKRAAQDSMIVT